MKIFLIVLLLIGCNNISEPTHLQKGKVKFISLEGGFYGIISDKNENFDPINLSKEFQKDDLKILFSYKERNDLYSFHMWGKIIELTEIKLDEE
ncbi:MAG: hypothetical protein ACOYU5_03195 [Stygiobacter sp.]